MSKINSLEWKQNLDKMLAKLEIIKALPVNGGLHLHVGCGPQILPGWINIDKYHSHADVLNIDMFKLPLGEKVADTIYSSHSLEHLPIRQGRSAILNWYKTLKPGGTLYLAIPDLEEILTIMLDKSIPLHNRENWFLYTLFGYQIDSSTPLQNLDLNLPVDPGQFHQSGFTEETIRHYLANAGFQILDLFHYDGWGTPSIFLEARK